MSHRGGNAGGEHGTGSRAVAPSGKPTVSPHHAAATAGFRPRTATSMDGFGEVPEAILHVTAYAPLAIGCAAPGRRLR